MKGGGGEGEAEVSKGCSIQPPTVLGLGDCSAAAVGGSLTKHAHFDFLQRNGHTRRCALCLPLPVSLAEVSAASLILERRAEVAVQPCLFVCL